MLKWCWPALPHSAPWLKYLPQLSHNQDNFTHLSITSFASSPRVSLCSLVEFTLLAYVTKTLITISVLVTLLSTECFYIYFKLISTQVIFCIGKYFCILTPFSYFESLFSFYLSTCFCKVTLLLFEYSFGFSDQELHTWRK